MRTLFTYLFVCLGLLFSGTRAHAQLTACINQSQDIFDCYSTPKPSPMPDPGSSWRGGVYNPGLAGRDARQKLKDLLNSEIDERYFKYCSVQMKCRYMSDANYKNHQQDGENAARKRAEDYQYQLTADVNSARSDADKLKNKDFNLENKGVKEAVKGLVVSATSGLKENVKVNEAARKQAEQQREQNKTLTKEALAKEETLKKETDDVIVETETEIEDAYRPELTKIEEAQTPAPSTDGDQDGVSAEVRLGELAGLGTMGSSPLMDEGPAYDMDAVDAELNGRAQAYLEVGAGAQGRRLVDRGIVYRNYQKGATLPYQHAQLSDSARQSYGGTWTSGNFQGYEAINVLNEFAANDRIQTDEILGFHSALLAARLQQHAKPDSIGYFLRDLEVAWSIIDFSKGLAKGVWVSVKGTVTGLYDMVFHFPETMKALRDAVVNYEATWAAIQTAAIKHYDILKNCDDALEKCGETVGLVTGEILQAVYGGSALKLVGASRAGRVAEAITLVGKEYTKRSLNIVKYAGKVGINSSEELNDFLKNLKNANPCNLSMNLPERSRTREVLSTLERLLVSTAYAGDRVVPCGGSFAQNLDDIRRAEDLLQFAANSGAEVAEVAGRVTNMRKFLERAHELAFEPAFGTGRISEGIGGARLEMHLGRKIERYNPGPEVPLETIKRTDFFEPTLGKIELKGPIFNRDGAKIPITNKIMKDFTASVLDEAKNTFNDVIFVDTLHMSTKQVEELRAAIKKAQELGEVKIPITIIP